MPTNFRVLSDLQLTHRRDFPVADPTILGPFGALPLIDGEWLELDANYQLIRGVGQGIAAVFPVHTEMGRYDVQAIQQVNVIYHGQYEFETRLFLPAGPYLVGTEVCVFTDATGRRSLQPAANAGDVIVGMVTRPPVGGYLRILHLVNRVM
jgi:hypothetical protein